MANTKAVTNREIDFERVLLPVDRRVVVEFFRVFMFLFVLPNVSDETNNTQFFTTIMKDHVFLPDPNGSPARNFCRDFEPGRNESFSGPLMLSATTPNQALLAQQTSMHFQKNFCSGGARR